MSESMRDALFVDFKMRRKRRPAYENDSEQFWICVTATPQRDDVRDIKIDMYQTDSSPDGLYTYLGAALTPYPLENGKPFTWDYREGDVVVVIVRYTLKADRKCWFVAASGVWFCDGLYFMDGARLKDRSELFNDKVYLQQGDNSARDARDEEYARVSAFAVRYWQDQHKQIATVGYTMELKGNYQTMLHIGDESVVLTIDKDMQVINAEMDTFKEE